MISEKQRVALRKQILGEKYNQIFSNSASSQIETLVESKPFEYKWGKDATTKSPMKLKWGQNSVGQVERIEAVEKNKSILEETVIQEKPKSKFIVL